MWIFNGLLTFCFLVLYIFVFFLKFMLNVSCHEIEHTYINVAIIVLYLYDANIYKEMSNDIQLHNTIRTSKDRMKLL